MSSNSQFWIHFGQKAYSWVIYKYIYTGGITLWNKKVFEEALSHVEYAWKFMHHMLSMHNTDLALKEGKCEFFSAWDFQQMKYST